MLAGKNILILTSKTGGGHVSLAEALRDMIEEDDGNEGDVGDREGARLPRGRITIVDPQPVFFHAHYRLVSRYALWLWAGEFQFLDAPGRARIAHSGFTRLVRRQLHQLLDEVRPDLILTTYPFLSYEVMRVLERWVSRIPLVMLFSDANGVHAAWLSERGAAATFAPTRETYEQALAAGFAPERLHLVGWPVRAQFAHAAGLSREQHAEILINLNLEPERFTVFLQGGGEGAARFGRTIENVLASGANGIAGTVGGTGGDVQVILATGTNRALLERYRQMPNLAPLPFTKEIAPFMAAADVVMGKAGPNMLFESMTLGKPFIATAYIPGQEQANLPFIQRHGLGWVALQPAGQRELLSTLVHSPDQLQAMLASVRAYRQWNSAANQCILPLLRSLLT